MVFFVNILITQKNYYGRVNYDKGNCSSSIIVEVGLKLTIVIIVVVFVPLIIYDYMHT